MIRKFILAALLLCAPSVYAQGTISAMTAASALSGTELFECVQSGTKKCTAAQIKTFTSASPTLVTPNIGTPSAGVLTNTTGYTVGALSGAGTGVLTALGVNIGSAGAPVLFNGAGGTPSSITLTNASGTAASLTAGTVTTNANLTGDVTSSGNATTLATVNSNVGSFTNANITVNAKGQITAAANGSGGAGTVTATGGALTANAVVLGAGTTDTKVVAGIVTDGVGALTLTSTVNATSADGLLLQNTTAAAAGAQQWSPRLHFKGQGWKTTSTAASQAVDWIAETVPVQGTTAPSSNLVFSASINGGAYSPRITAQSGGAVLLGASSTAGILFAPGNTASSIGFYLFDGSDYGAIKVGKLYSTQSIFVPSSGNLTFSSTDNTGVTPTGDLFLTRSAGATLQLGAVTGSGAAVAQTLQVQGSSGNSAAAALFTIAGSDQSGTTTTGGGVKIRGGNGTSAGGAVEIWTSATTTPAVAVSVAADKTATFSGSFILATSATPAAADACTAGRIVWGADYIYVCTATGAWKRAALTGGY